MSDVHRRTCSLCDALCRVRVEVEGGAVRRVTGEPDDPFSQGHVCPKAMGLKDLQEDPDRVRAPLRRVGSGWEEIGWEEALSEAADRLARVRRAHGRDAVGLYLGNPNSHHYANLLAMALVVPVLGTRARFSAISLDSLPHLVASREVMGHGLMGAVPDVDRTDLLLVLGANPWVANGGGMASGDVRRRVRGVVERGGQVIVLDPRRTETAEAASAYHAIRPGSDAALLLAIVHTLFAEGRVDAGAWRGWTDGLAAVEAAAARFPPARVAAATGLSAEVIVGLARALSEARTSVVYGRMGVCTQAFGGLAAWLLIVVNTLTGNLDRPGGLMLPRPAVDLLGVTGIVGQERVAGATRGAGWPSFAGELPTAAMADEILRPGPGAVRGLLTVAGNPALSAPDSAGMARALASLEAHVAVDLYINETTRHAHLILPGLPPLEREHYPLGLASITVRTIAAWSAPLFPPSGPDDGETLLELASRLARAEGRWGWVAVGALMKRLGPRRLLDLLLRAGPYGVGRGGLRLADLEASPLTVDLGALVPQLPGRLRTPGRRLQLAPALMLADLPRLEAWLDGPRPALVLIGRRDLRSNNSWMHNSERLVRGRDRCTLLVHPDDAAARGLGARAVVRSAAGEVEVPVEVSDAVMPGVVSLPHGWGHAGGRQAVAERRPGVNANQLTDAAVVDPLTGTAVFNGVPVEVEAV
jgi:anaerobic selenocysteine-containing dehydrogenase